MIHISNIKTKKTEKNLTKPLFTNVRNESGLRFSEAFLQPDSFRTLEE